MLTMQTYISMDGMSMMMKQPGFFSTSRFHLQLHHRGKPADTEMTFRRSVFGKCVREKAALDNGIMVLKQLSGHRESST